MTVWKPIIVILFVCLASSYVYGQSPMINYQGKVTDSEGVPLAGSCSIQFSIYGQEAGGTALWTEMQSSVTIQNGIFTVLLGNVTSIQSTVFNGDARWLGVKVGSDPELSPRQPIVSIGYALRADKANEADDSDRLDNHDASYFATAGHSHDSDYVNDNSGEIDDESDFNLSSPTLINNLNADLLDGLDASSFMDTTNDYGRSGVATDLYEGTTKLSDRYLNDVGPDTMTGNYHPALLTINNSGGGCALICEGAGTSSGCIIQGVATTTANVTGVYGSSYGDAGWGVTGWAWGINGFGVRGVGNSSNGTGVWGDAAASGMGVYGKSAGGTGVYGENLYGNIGVYGTTSTGPYGIYCSGNFGASGTKSCIVRTSKGPAKLYCQESPENWFEDFGEGQLSEGRCQIELDPLFLETVTINGQNPMKVFIQLNDNCNGTFVKRGQTGFEVVELQEGTSNAHFTYRVLAKRKGYENTRFEISEASKEDPHLYPEMRDEIVKE